MAWQRWFDRSKRSYEAHPENVEKDVQDAYTLLQEAQQRGTQVPFDVVSTLTQARTAATDGKLEGELETKFWNAYGQLRNSIKPAERARRTYKMTFYCVLAALLLGQFSYLDGVSVQKHIDEIGKQLSASQGKAAAPDKGPATPDLYKQQKAYLSMALSIVRKVDNIVDAPSRIAGLLSPLFSKDPAKKASIKAAAPGSAPDKQAVAPGSDPDKQAYTSIHSDSLLNAVAPGSAPDEQAYTFIKGELEMMLLFFSGSLLPMLYGLLGACAFVLRKLSDETDQLTYAYDARARYTLRLNIGLLAGLAVGWFTKPTDPSVASLSPFALAFVAGYGNELFFVFLDKFVHAFVSVGGADTRTTTQTTTGGITTTHSSEVATRVAGTTVSREAERTTAAAAAETAKESQSKAEPVATSAGIVTDPLKGSGQNEGKMPAQAESPTSQRSDNGKYDPVAR